MQGLQRATEAARASRGLPPRTVHARSIAGGNLTMCGRGEVTGRTFTGIIADEPGEVTCKNCLKISGAIERDRAMRARFVDEDQRWQVEEARRTLAAWDAERGDGSDVYDRERVLADHVRTLLAVIDQVAPAVEDD